MIQLRPYQQELSNHATIAYQQGNQNTLIVLSTGGGKTVIIGNEVKNNRGVSFVIAHRHELVSQISTMLGRFGIRHRIVGSNKTIKEVVKTHVREFGTSFYDPNSLVVVASVDTLIKRKDISELAMRCSLWVIDEAHHVLKDNKWGKAASMFPNARGIGVTATPIRADGKGLGRHADGVFDILIEGPTMRWLIENGNLTEYRIFCPGSDLDLSSEKVGSTGDYSTQQLAKAAKKSHIVGDVIESYIKFANGKQGIVFATDVDTAEDMAKKFNDVGIPTAAVSARTNDAERSRLVYEFQQRKLRILVNVDLFGEGFDVPGIEVVSMARPTQSYALYSQQFGRALRPLDGKEYAIIIDHVNNVVTHGLPDAKREWTLDRVEKRGGGNGASDAIPLKSCPECSAPYEKIYKACPFCGFEIIPISRGGPEFVDGDLIELTPETLKQMRGELEKAQKSPALLSSQMQYAGVPKHIANARANQQFEKIASGDELLNSMAIWTERHLRAGYDQSMIYRKFYFQFNTDMLTARTQDKKTMDLLREQIDADNL